MSKPVKDLILGEYRKRFGDLANALLIDVRGINAIETNKMRLSLARKDIRITILKNSLARRAFAGTGLAALGDAMTGPSALAYGAESVVDVARELLDWARKMEHLQLKAAVLEGDLFTGKDGVERLSRFPTKAEAQARVVGVALSPASRLVGAATSPGARILGIVKEIRTRLEKGETITRA